MNQKHTVMVCDRPFRCSMCQNEVEFGDELICLIPQRKPYCSPCGKKLLNARNKETKPELKPPTAQTAPAPGGQPAVFIRGYNETDPLQDTSIYLTKQKYGDNHLKMDKRVSELESKYERLLHEFATLKAKTEGKPAPPPFNPALMPVTQSEIDAAHESLVDEFDDDEDIE